MTCDLLTPWLHLARSSDELPEEGRAHLQTCAACRAQLARLMATDAAVRQMSPPADAGGRASLLLRVAATPQQRTAPRGRRSSPRTLWPVAVAAGVCLVVGMGIGRWMLPPRSPAAAVAESGAVVPAPPLLAAVARETATASEGNLDAFVRMAAALRAEAMTRVRAGAVDELPRLAAAHERILRTGIAPALKRLPEFQRPTAAVRLVAEFDAAATALTTDIGRSPPALGDPLKPLQASCASAAAQFGRAEPLLSDGPPVESSSLLDDVVDRTARVADAGTPMARAEASGELAGTLAQVISVLAVAGHAQDAAAVTESFDRVLSAGIEANLERAAAGPDRPSDADVQRVRERSATAVAVLERNLAAAPPAARAGLERAISAGKGKAGKPAHPVHPVKGYEKEPKGKGGVPPGWLKKQ